LMDYVVRGALLTPSHEKFGLAGVDIRMGEDDSVPLGEDVQDTGEKNTRYC
jgi:hypothetical protein